MSFIFYNQITPSELGSIPEPAEGWFLSLPKGCAERMWFRQAQPPQYPEFGQNKMANKNHPVLMR